MQKKKAALTLLANKHIIMLAWQSIYGSKEFLGVV